MKTVAGAAGDAEAGEGEASAAAKAAAALCCAGAEARVRSPGAERRMLGHCWRRARRGRGRLAGEGAGGGEAGEEPKKRQMLPGEGGGGGGGGRRGTKNRRMRAGRGLSRLTGPAAPRPGLWPDDEERAPEGD